MINAETRRGPCLCASRKISSLGLNPKDGNSSKKVAEGMLPLMVEIPLTNFINECAKGGQSLTDEEYESLGDLSGVWQAFSGNGKLRSGDNELQSGCGKSRRGCGRSQSNNRNLSSGDNIPQPSDNITQPGDDIPQVQKEEDMYPLIAEILNKICHLKNAQFAYKDTANWPETDVNDSKPDGAIYPTTPQAENAWKLDTKTLRNVTEHREPYAARTAWAFMEAYIEIKRTQNRSAFYNQTRTDGSFLRWDDSKGEKVVQLIKYASEIFLRQHREFQFSIYITGVNVRLIRWDRVGVVVSSNINLNTDSRQFLDFVARFVTMTSAERGHDPTVQLATPAQIVDLRRYRHPTKYGQRMVKEVLDNNRLFPIHQVRCQVIDDDDDDSTPPSSRIFLIGISLAGSRSLTGRATRGYAAYDLGKRQLVFMKDSWRSNAGGVHPELEVYARLKKAGVEQVATAIGGGDVGGPEQIQSTQNQEWISKPKAPSARVHYRLITLQVGRPLDSYERSTDLILAVTDAFFGHCEAWTKAGVLHRDISVNNILIDINPSRLPGRIHSDEDLDLDAACNSDEDPDLGGACNLVNGRNEHGDVCGFLNDWDHCKYADELNSGAAQQSRSGTWAFLSAHLLKYPKKPNSLSDDLESFVHVLAWQALRFHVHDKSPPSCLKNPPYDSDEVFRENRSNKALRTCKERMFDDELDIDGFYVGGEEKLSCIQKGDPGFRLANYFDTIEPPLGKLLSSLYGLLKEHYASQNPEDLQKYAVKRHGVTLRPSHTQRLIMPGSMNSSRGRKKRIMNLVATSSSAVASAAPRPVLDTHDYMMQVLEDVFKAEQVAANSDDGAGSPVIWYEWDDKTPDQFYGLEQASYAPPKGSTGSKQNTSTYRSSNLTATTSSMDIAAQSLRPDRTWGSVSVSSARHKRKTVSSDDEPEPEPRPKMLKIDENDPIVVDD